MYVVSIKSCPEILKSDIYQTWRRKTKFFEDHRYSTESKGLSHGESQISHVIPIPKTALPFDPACPNPPFKKKAAASLLNVTFSGHRQGIRPPIRGRNGCL
jgi:hypothetical protein